MATSKAVSGALTPLDAAEFLYQNGLHHLSEPAQLTFLKNIYGALLLSLAGHISLIAANGLPGLAQNNPSIPKIVQGALFPIGLVITYFIGAELYTGFPMWLAMTALRRKGRVVDYVKCLVVSWVGNVLGALFAAYFFSYLTLSLHEEPYRSGLTAQVTSDVVEAAWHVIFLKAIACGFMVTLAMFFGAQNNDGISKALGLHLPFFISTTARYPHTVEYMYLASIGMMLGAPLSVGAFLWKCMLPISLGNSVGGAVFVGAYNWWVYLNCEDGENCGKGAVRLDGVMGS